MARIKAKNAQEILLADFQALVNDTERLLEHSATLAGDGAEEVRAKITIMKPSIISCLSSDV